MILLETEFPWEEVQMLNIPRLSTSTTGYGVRLGPSEVTHVLYMCNSSLPCYANRIVKSGVPL